MAGLALGLGLSLNNGAAGFNPLTLFGAGEKGLIWDASLVSSLSQDTAGTTPVTAYTDPVGRILDLSGNGNHGTQTLTNRPTWNAMPNGRPALLLDGSNDSLTTPAIDLTGTDRVTVLVGMRKVSDAVRGMLLEFGPSASFTQAFSINAPSSNGATNLVWTAAGSVAVALTATPYAAGNNYVLNGAMDISDDTNIFRINGGQVATSGNNLGTGNLGNKVLYVGRRDGATLPFNGYITCMIVIGRLLTAGETALAEAWINARTGAY